MDLKSWMQGQKPKPWSYGDLAEACEFDRETGRRYAEGKRVPKKPHGQKIYVVTRGAVTPNDFYELPALPAGEGAPA